MTIVSISNKKITSAIVTAAALRNIEIIDCDYDISDHTLQLTTNAFTHIDASPIANEFLNEAFSQFNANVTITNIDGDISDSEIFIDCEIIYA